MSAPEPPLSRADARAVRFNVEDATRSALHGAVNAPANRAERDLRDLRQLYVEQRAEIDLLQRVIFHLTETDCRCGTCKLCSCRNMAKGSLRRHPGRREP